MQQLSCEKAAWLLTCKSEDNKVEMCYSQYGEGQCAVPVTTPGQLGEQGLGGRLVGDNSQSSSASVSGDRPMLVGLATVAYQPPPQPLLPQLPRCSHRHSTLPFSTLEKDVCRG